MARARSITMHHLAVTVLVVILVNAQLTWWIVFVLRQNRTLLDLERERMAEACRLEAARVLRDLELAQHELALWIVSREGYGSSGLWGADNAPPEPFARWAEPGELDGPPGWRLTGEGRLLFSYPGDHQLKGVVAADEWLPALLTFGGDFELREANGAIDTTDARPVTSLPPPFTHLVISPAREAWNASLDEYRRRILMMVSEGTFFAVMLLVLIGLLWQTLRREVELERQHRNFLSAITHELKSPLASIRLALETVVSGRADEVTSTRFLNNAMADTERLQDLVQKVLETTRYGHGGKLEMRRKDISEVVESSVAAVRPRIEALGGEIRADVEPRCCAGIDEEAFQIAVSNLMENAVKYGGSPPEVRVELKLNSDWAVLDISDNGDGIAQDDIPLVFQRFFRAGDELSRTTHGTGLGLYLVRQIIRAHRGTVKITSTGPDGTTFRVEVPGADRKECGP